jgi:alkanesulfonate monooxygenase SsuD/methylene tetrahydromethanopterin reductase-like flavin-dependent oxidoreductase (luciferase family)
VTTFGYTLMCEQAGPTQLVDDAVRAERAGFDFAAVSDHYYPWLGEQGHAPYAWSVLGAAAYATSRIGLMSFVTCPIRRYHPAVVAQRAATIGVMAEGRFTLGLGAGENLNEHVAGGWPHVAQRHDMLVEALDIIRPLLAGETVHHGGEYADALIATEPKPELFELFDNAGGAGKPRYGQVPICYGPDEAQCRKIAHEQFRWFGLGWPVNSELPNPTSFERASAAVTEDAVARSIPCGSDLDKHVQAIRTFAEAGYTHVAVVQIGAGQQAGFLDFAERDLLPALR